MQNQWVWPLGKWLELTNTPTWILEIASNSRSSFFSSTWIPLSMFTVSIEQSEHYSHESGDHIQIYHLLMPQITHALSRPIPTLQQLMTDLRNPMANLNSVLRLYFFYSPLHKWSYALYLGISNGKAMIYEGWHVFVSYTKRNLV